MASYPSSPDVLPEAVALAVFSLPSVLLLIMPFIWHWQARNVAACALIFYLSYDNLVTFVNAIIWHNEHYESWWPGYGLCDVQAKLYYPVMTGIPSATCCITMNLAQALDVDTAVITETRAARRRKIVVDLLICFALPVMQAALHYIFQPSRYYIEAVGGCLPSVSHTWPYLVVWLIWSPIILIINCVYAGMAPQLLFGANKPVLVIKRLHKYKSQFSRVLSSSSSGLSTTRFIRLLLMSLSILVIYAPVSLYLFVKSVDVEWQPYSWAADHQFPEWNYIMYLPKDIYTHQKWIPIGMSVLVFVFFGMGDDAIDIYRSWLVALGLARLWPSLREPRRRRRSGHSSLSSRFSLIRKVKDFLSVSEDSQSNSATNAGHDFSPSSPSEKGCQFSIREGKKFDGSKSAADCSTELYSPSSSSQFPPSPSAPSSATLHSYSPRHNLFRTHVNLPFPLSFPTLWPKRQSSSTAAPARPQAEHCERTASVCSDAYGADVELGRADDRVQTHVWSEPRPASHGFSFDKLRKGSKPLPSGTSAQPVGSCPQPDTGGRAQSKSDLVISRVVEMQVTEVREGADRSLGVANPPQ